MSVIEVPVQLATPYVRLDVAAAVTRYRRLAVVLPHTGLHHAVRANAHPGPLRGPAAAGCGFAVPCPAELVAAVRAGADPAAVLHSGPAELPADVAFAARLGVRRFVVGSRAEARTVATVAR